MMKAAVYYGRHDLRLVDLPAPECSPEEVRIRLAYCGVCGTDHHIFHGDGGAAPVMSLAASWMQSAVKSARLSRETVSALIQTTGAANATSV